MWSQTDNRRIIEMLPVIDPEAGVKMDAVLCEYFSKVDHIVVFGGEPII